MIGYILTVDEKDQIQDQYYTEYQFFNCVQDIDDVWYLMLSDEDQPEVEASQYVWVLDLPQGEYVPPLPPPFPPTN